MKVSIPQQPQTASSGREYVGYEAGSSGSCTEDGCEDEDPASSLGCAAAVLRDRMSGQGSASASANGRDCCPTVALITSEKTPAHLVSAVSSALAALGLATTASLSVTHTTPDSLRRVKPALAFNLARGLAGPLGDAQVPALLSVAGVPFVGATGTSLSLLRDRAGCLRALRDAGLPVTAFHEVISTSPDSKASIGRFPVEIRPATAGMAPEEAAVVCADEMELAAELERRAGEWMVAEECVPDAQASRVLSVLVLGNRAKSPLASPRSSAMLGSRGFHVFKPLQQGSAGSGHLAEPSPPLAPEECCRICDIAIASVEALGLSDFASVDVQVTPACRVARVVAVRVLPDLDPVPFLSVPGAMPAADVVAILASLALTRSGAMRPASAATLQAKQNGGGMLNSLHCISTPSSVRPSFIDNDDVDIILGSSPSGSTCSSPPLPSLSSLSSPPPTTTPAPTVSTSPALGTGGPSKPLAAVAQASIVSYKKSEVPPEKWNDWRWQLANRLTSAEQLRTILPLTAEEEAAFDGTSPLFPVAVTPYFASLIDPNDPHDPVRLQVLPRALEAHRGEEDIEDSLNEDAHSPVPGLVHRYPDRVLMLVSMTCASYCRFCTRNRVVGSKLQTGPTEPLSAYYERQLGYIRSHPVVRDVVVSGGDPLLLPMRTLDWILTELGRIPHVEVVRIGSRVPIFVPQRVTPELCAMLSRHHPLWMNVHINHPNELTPDSGAALARLANAGIPLGSQTVLLAGVNDCPNVMLALMRKIVQNRVRPYYIYQCDLVVGAAHFRTPTSKLTEIIEAIRGHTSGFCVPTAVIDAPHGGGKVPVMPNYLISQSEFRTVVRNFEGFITTYTGPRSYPGHDPRTCSYCRHTTSNEQDGVAALLAGKALTIKPERWDETHERRPAQQRCPHAF